VRRGGERARICVLTLDPTVVGGVQTRLAAFMRYAASRGHDCDVYFPAQRAQALSDAETRLSAFGSLSGVHAVRVPEPLPHFGRAEWFARRCDIPHGYDAHQVIAGSLQLALPFLRHRRRFVAWIAGPFGSEAKAMPRTKLRHHYLYNRLSLELTRRQEVRAGRAASLIMPVSSFTSRLLQRELGLAASAMRVLPGPVDTDCFTPGEAAIEPRPYILTVSRLQRGKGMSTVLAAFRRIVERMPVLELRIVGDGPERVNLERVARRWKLTGSVNFVGERTDAALIREYRGATIFLLASDYEALGNVVVEAMACGLPVVSSDCGGPADPIAHGRTGLLVPVRDARALADAALRVLRDPGLARRLGDAARREAVSRYGTESIARELDRAYREVFHITTSPSPTAPA